MLQRLKLHALLLTVFALIVLSGCGGGKSNYRSIKDIKKSGVLNVYVNPAGKPFAYIDSGILTGSEINAVEEIARSLSVSAAFREATTSEIYAAIQAGEADLAVGMLIDTLASRNAVSFTNPTGSERLYSLSLTGTLYNTTGALNEKRLGVTEGSASEYGLIVSDITPSETIPYPSISAAITGLISGECDAVICSEPEANEFAEANTGRLAAELIINGGEVKFSAMTAKGNSELMDAANKALGRME